MLERQPGADVEGYAGLQDGVDYHWWDLVKAAGLSTLLSVGAELATNDDDRPIQAIRNGGQDTINDAGQQIVRRHFAFLRVIGGGCEIEERECAQAGIMNALRPCDRVTLLVMAKSDSAKGTWPRCDGDDPSTTRVAALSKAGRFRARLIAR